MACYKGNAGVVKMNSGDVAQIKSYSINESADTSECTSMGDSYREYVATLKSWDGSMDVVWDKQDSDADLAVGGVEVGIEVYPEGTGDKYSGNVIVTSFDVSADMGDVIAASLSFTGTGALTRTLT